MPEFESHGGVPEANEVALTKVGELIQELMPGSMVQRFVLMVETIDGEDQERYFSGYTAPGQKRWDSMGLLDYALTVERSIVVVNNDDDD